MRPIRVSFLIVYREKDIVERNRRMAQNARAPILIDPCLGGFFG